MLKKLFMIVGTVILFIGCAGKIESSTVTEETALTKVQLIDQEACPSLKYSDKFNAAFVRKGACGTLKNVEFVLNYNGASCSGSEQIVNMDKYISERTGSKCDSYPIYTYTKKSK